MKRLILFAIIITGSFLRTNAQEVYRIPENINRIVFLGNSITYGGHYISYIETGFKINHPERKLEFINVGLPSETVSGLSEPNHADGKFPRPDLHDRLDRVLKELKPDLVFACYGMNDGIYMPFDESRFQKYKDGINWLHKEVVESGSLIIHLTPQIFDEQKGRAYANVLDIYSDWLLSKQFTDNWDVIDIHWPMKKYLGDKRLADPDFKFAKDGIHPNKIGHWVMAQPILSYLGEDLSANCNDIQSMVASFTNGTEILSLIEERQVILKDAWLNHIGHKRPGMKQGLPISDATEKAKEIEARIQKLLN